MVVSSNQRGTTCGPKSLARRRFCSDVCRVRHHREQRSVEQHLPEAQLEMLKIAERDLIAGLVGKITGKPDDMTPSTHA